MNFNQIGGYATLSCSDGKNRFGSMAIGVLFVLFDACACQTYKSWPFSRKKGIVSLIDLISILCFDFARFSSIAFICALSLEIEFITCDGIRIIVSVG